MPFLPNLSNRSPFLDMYEDPFDRRSEALRQAQLDAGPPTRMAPPVDLPEAMPISPRPWSERPPAPLPRVPLLPPPTTAQDRYQQALDQPLPARPGGWRAKVGDALQVGIFGMPELKRQREMEDRATRLNELGRAAQEEERRNYHQGILQDRAQREQDMAEYRRQMGEAAVDRADAAKTTAESRARAGMIKVAEMPPEHQELFPEGTVEVPVQVYQSAVKDARFADLNETRRIIAAEANKSREAVAAEAAEAQRYKADRQFSSVLSRIDAGMRKAAKAPDPTKAQDRAEYQKSQAELAADLEFRQKYLQIQRQFRIGTPEVPSVEKLSPDQQKTYYAEMLLINRGLTERKQAAQNLYARRMGSEDPYQYGPEEGEQVARQKLQELEGGAAAPPSSSSPKPAAPAAPKRPAGPGAAPGTVKLQRNAQGQLIDPRTGRPVGEGAGAPPAPPPPGPLPLPGLRRFR